MDKIAGVALVAAAGTTTYTWLQQATSIAELVVMAATALGAMLAAWFYYERARKMRQERLNDKGGDTNRNGAGSKD